MEIICLISCGKARNWGCYELTIPSSLIYARTDELQTELQTIRDPVINGSKQHRKMSYITDVQVFHCVNSSFWTPLVLSFPSLSIRPAFGTRSLQLCIRVIYFTSPLEIRAAGWFPFLIRHAPLCTIYRICPAAFLAQGRTNIHKSEATSPSVILVILLCSFIWGPSLRRPTGRPCTR